MTEPAEPLVPGSTIGILGGGQLGRMLAMAAARLGFHAHVYDPDPAAPARETALQHTAAPYDDAAALARFAEAVDVVTYEFENIPPAALDVIESRAPIRPSRRSLVTTRDRLKEKTFLVESGLAVAPHAPVDDMAALEEAVRRIGLPAILKTRELGYDGKGQVRIVRQDDLAGAWETIGRAPAVLEAVVPFEKEISVVIARGGDGAMAAFDPAENLHEDGILKLSKVPATIPPALADRARAMAARVAETLDHVGVLAVEMFVTQGGLVVNEVAPRVHNSGHWTEAVCPIDQFEQHIRAIAGWPLGRGERIADAEMVNLLGEEVLEAPRLAREPWLRLHLYGKAEIRPGRKMGHYTRIVPPGRG